LDDDDMKGFDYRVSLLARLESDTDAQFNPLGDLALAPQLLVRTTFARITLGKVVCEGSIWIINSGFEILNKHSKGLFYKMIYIFN
jgi:hypothetical protein